MRARTGCARYCAAGPISGEQSATAGGLALVIAAAVAAAVVPDALYAAPNADGENGGARRMALLARRHDRRPDRRCTQRAPSRSGETAILVLLAAWARRSHDAQAKQIYG